jgi:cytidylate kinase
MQTTHANRDMSRLAERQMRNWTIELQTKQRLEEERKRSELEQLLHPFVSISREAGVDAAPIAEAVAARCGWRALDRELLDYMAHQENLPRIALEFVDERAVSWFHEVFGKWLDRQLVSQAEYVSRLGQLLLLTALHESTVFVGRGAQFMLPRQCGLNVRVIAPLKQRVHSIMERRHCTEREAKEFIEKTDRGREQFVQKYFHRNVADAELYDLIINLAQIPREDAIDLIAREAKQHEQRVLSDVSGLETTTREFRRLREKSRAR